MIIFVFRVLGHRSRQGKVLRRQLPPPRRDRRRMLRKYLRTGHLEGHGDLPAVGRRPSVRSRLAFRRQAWLL